METYLLFSKCQNDVYLDKKRRLKCDINISKARKNRLIGSD